MHNDISFGRDPIINISGISTDEAIALASTCEVIKVRIEAIVSGVVVIPVRFID